MLTAIKLKLIFVIPHGWEFYEHWAHMLEEILPDFDINTKERVAAFLSQCAHESAEFTRLSENLNYSALGLIKTWPSRFTAIEAQGYANKPEEIANHAYSLRNGNGDVKSGDGWNYRGRGLIQITGRANYALIGSHIDIDLEGAPEMAELPEVAIKTACAYFEINNLNRLSDAGDVMKLTRAINGGLNGLKERQAYYNRAMAAL